MKQVLLACCVLSCLAGVLVQRSTDACEPARTKLEFLIPAQIAVPTSDTAYDLRLTNVSRTPLWVNKRMAIGRSEELAPYREVWFDFTSAGGRKIDFDCEVRIGEATGSDYVLLSPGESASKKVGFVCFSGLLKPGIYTGVAHYRDGTTVPPPPPQGSSALTEKVVSSKFEFKVVRP